MDEKNRDPREDISYIKRILEKTTADMKTVAPWFAGFGIVWLVYGLLCAGLRIFQNLAAPAAQVPLANAGAILGWVFYIVLAAGFFLVRRQQKQRGLDTLARKLIDMWGVCILLFLTLTVGFEIAVPFAAVHVFAFSAEAASWLSMACSDCESCLVFLMPLLPLLITAIFLENRRMLWAGIVLAALAALIDGAHILFYWTSAAVFPALRTWIEGWKVAACLLDLLPGVMLLLFGRSLKRA